jgi:hypoxanthine phosphoribosyltransferase
MEPLFTPKQLDIQIKIVAKQINDEHRGDNTPIIFVGLLNGCFMFYSDLVKNIQFNIECDFMRVKSYNGKKQGDIQITKDLETPIKGKHVYLIDDILDSGNTMRAVIDYLTVKKPNSISIVTLLTRETSPTFEYPTYSVFTIKDEWVLGYGMDDNKGYKRNYPIIFKM